MRADNSLSASTAERRRYSDDLRRAEQHAWMWSLFPQQPQREEQPESQDNYDSPSSLSMPSQREHHSRRNCRRQQLTDTKSLQDERRTDRKQPSFGRGIQHSGIPLEIRCTAQHDPSSCASTPSTYSSFGHHSLSQQQLRVPAEDDRCVIHDVSSHQQDSDERSIFDGEVRHFNECTIQGYEDPGSSTECGELHLSTTTHDSNWGMTTWCLEEEENSHSKARCWTWSGPTTPLTFTTTLTALDDDGCMLSDAPRLE